MQKNQMKNQLISFLNKKKGEENSQQEESKQLNLL